MFVFSPSRWIYQARLDVSFANERFTDLMSFEEREIVGTLVYERRQWATSALSLDDADDRRFGAADYGLARDYRLSSDENFPRSLSLSSTSVHSSCCSKRYYYVLSVLHRR